MPLTFDRRLPEGEPLFAGDMRVVEAWNRRGLRDRRGVRAMSLGFAALWVAGAAGGIVPAWVALAALGAVAVLAPLAVLETGGRAAQKGFDIYERGVHGTQRRRLLRFRRFAPFPEIVSGDAREVAAGKHAVVLTLMDGSSLASVPGEVTDAALQYLKARTGDQIRTAALRPPREKAEQTL